MAIRMQSTRAAWTSSAVLAAVALAAIFVSYAFEWDSHVMIALGVTRFALGVLAAALLAYGWSLMRLRSSERVLSALVEQLEHSECDAFKCEPVTNGRVVSLERAPTSRTSAVPRPTGGRPFSVAQPEVNGRSRSRASQPWVGPRGRA